MNTITVPREPLPSGWRLALPAMSALWILILVVYREPAAQMVGVWLRSNTFAHGFLVLPISLWLVWRLRDQLASLSPRPDARWLAPMLVVSLVWLLAHLAMVNAAEQFALVGLLVLSVPAALGAPVALALLFPLLFLFFAVPFGEFMLPPMMDWTANFVVQALQVTGVPVYREGLQFVIPTGTWSVIDECSGVRYLIASFMVGSLFAYLNYRSPKRRAVFMLVSLLVPILANWLRAYLIVMMGHLSGNKLAVGVDHLLYGWVFFGVVIFIMFTIGMRWSEPEAPVVNSSPQTAVEAGQGSPRIGWMSLAVAAVVVMPHLAIGGLERHERSAAEPSVSFPAQLAGAWTTTDAGMAEGWKASYPTASLQARKIYTSPEGQVGVLVAYFRGQTADRKLVSSVNEVVGINDRVWNRVGGGSSSVSVDGAELSFATHDIQGPTNPANGRRQRLQACQLYWVDGRFMGGGAAAKLAGVLSRLRGHGDEGAIVVLFAEGESAEASRAAIERFARDNLASLNQVLQRTRETR